MGADMRRIAIAAAFVLCLAHHALAQNIVKQAPLTFNGSDFADSSGVLGLKNVGAPAALGWVAAVDPNNTVVFTASRAMTVTDIRGRVATPVGVAATVAVYKAASGTACGSGTAQHSSTFNANGTAATNQSLTLAGGAANVLAAGDSLCIVTTGTWTGAGAGNGAITVTVQ